MKREDVFKGKPKPVRHEMPTYTPSKSLVGPETITGLVRDIEFNKVRLWDDALGRNHYATVEHLGVLQNAAINKQPITVTTEKIRGRWTITGVE